ncbi:MAG: thioredoxin [Thermoplasmatota archaeon]
MNETEDKEVEELKQKMVEEMMNEDEKSLDYPDSPITLTDSDFQEKLEKYPLVLVDFWAAWCGPCKMMEPVIEDLAQEYEGDIVFGKLNVDQNQRVPSQFQVSGIPTLILFKNGEMVDRMVGAQNKQMLEQKIKSHL